MANLKKILNLHEDATHLRLKDVCKKHDASVFSKVRLADVFPIEGSGISDREYRFALQSHFDFVVADCDHEPQFAVEFDGVFHAMLEQHDRDVIKDDLCKNFDLPLLRVNSRYLPKKYRGMDLLSWFVEVWFAYHWFSEEQAAGRLPNDEPFMVQGMSSIAGSDKHFPLWLSANARNKIQKLCTANRVKDWVPSHVIGRAEDGTYRAIAYIRLNDEQGVMVESAMRSQLFPISSAQALDEIIIIQLFQRIEDTFEGLLEPITLVAIAQRVRAFHEKYELRLAMTSGEGIENEFLPE